MLTASTSATSPGPIQPDTADPAGSLERIALLVDHGFAHEQLAGLTEALNAPGVVVEIIAPSQVTEVVSDGGKETAVDCSVGDVRPGAFVALVILGGWSADRLRSDDDIIAFVNGAAAIGLPIAAVGHAGSLLIEAGLVRGRQVTSWPSIRTDLINAGAFWVDEAVVVDGLLITARNSAAMSAVAAAVQRALSEQRRLRIHI